MRYLIVDEWGNLFQTNTLTKQVLQMANDGFITNLVDIEEGKEFYTHETGWFAINEWEES